MEYKCNELESACYGIYNDAKTWSKEDREDFVEWVNANLQYLSSQNGSISKIALHAVEKQYDAYLHAIDGKEYTFKE